MKILIFYLKMRWLNALFFYRHFSEDNVRAMDTSWYKRAVDQHTVEPDSFVYSVPFGSGYAIKSNLTLVTASHAIFVEHRGHKAPAGVVGLQFQHDSLAKHFINITSAVNIRLNALCLNSLTVFSTSVPVWQAVKGPVRQTIWTVTC